MKSLLSLLPAVAVLAAACTSPAHAQQASAAADFPNRTIRVVVPFAAGGGVDILARLVGQHLNVLFGKPVVVENHPGATGLVAAQVVGSTGGDGYTFLVGAPSTFSVLPALKSNLPYNNLRDFMPVTLFGTAPEALVVHPAVPAKTIPELVALLKANPKKYNFANTGPGGLPHLSSILFEQLSGTELTHVPYRGTAPALAGVVSGHVEGMIDALISQLPSINDGRVRALGVTTPQRSQSLPDVPAIAEVLPGYEAMAWVGLFAAPGTPPAIVEKMQAAIRQVLQLPEVRERLMALATLPGGQSAQEFAAFIARDVERWRAVGKAANVVLE